MRLRRPRTLLVVAAAALATVLVAPPAADAVRSFGNTPYDDVRDAAAATGRSCTLSDNGLAALVFSVTWPETGAGTGPPSPMTLSRYDTASGLYYGGNASTRYQRAFFHPGVGMWQFDSAGLGAPRYAAHYISSAGGAPSAASTMAQRYCAASGTGAQRRAAAWQPWHACREGACEAIFTEIYNTDTGQLRAISGTSAVQRRGGMVERTCTRGGSTSVIASCFFISPSAAQGQDWWTNPSNGSSPVTAPFYNFQLDGYEYRVWLKEDTGYPVDIEARRPLGQNARTSLTWNDSTALCAKVTTSQVFCDVAPSHPFYTSIQWVANNGVAGGYSDGDFRPVDPVTRQAMAAFLFRLAGSPASFNPGAPDFSDVPASHPFFKEIEWVAAENVAEGYDDGTYKPLRNVARQAMAAFMYRMGGRPAFTPGTQDFSDVPPSHPFFEEIEWVAFEGVANGYDDGTYKPDRRVTRQAMASFLRRLHPLIDL